MNIQLEQVKEFMITMGQTVNEYPTEVPKNIQKLRISLIFEELKEYAIASGELDYFVEKLCVPTYKGFSGEGDLIPYVPVVDQVEQLDALLDMQYVLSGAVHAHGFGELFDEAFNEVQRSNMSKVDFNIENAELTKKKYEKLGANTTYKLIPETGDYVTYDLDNNNKVLKSHRYKPAQVAQFLK